MRNAVAVMSILSVSLIAVTGCNRLASQEIAPKPDTVVSREYHERHLEESVSRNIAIADSLASEIAALTHERSSAIAGVQAEAESTASRSLALRADGHGDAADRLHADLQGMEHHRDQQLAVIDTRLIQLQDYHAGAIRVKNRYLDELMAIRSADVKAAVAERDAQERSLRESTKQKIADINAKREAEKREKGAWQASETKRLIDQDAAITRQVQQIGGRTIEDVFRIVTIDFSGSQITDDELPTAVPWNVLDRLIKIDVHGTKLTDRSVVFLSSMSQLKEIDIHDSAISRDGAVQLKKQLPKTQITFYVVSPDKK